MWWKLLDQGDFGGVGENKGECGFGVCVGGGEDEDEVVAD